MDWVDVNDKLPEYQAISVLVCMSSGLVRSTLYCENKNFFDAECGVGLFGDTDETSAHFRHARRYGYKVTHWMPLPETPREQKTMAEDEK